MTLSDAPAVRSRRSIAHRSYGSGKGAVTRLMSPGDIGEIIKPFVFLDHFDLGPSTETGMGLHPHSGIATLTYLFEGNVRYEDTTGERGELHAGDVEWFKAARGAWHGGSVGDAPRARGFQLWIALAPGHELAEVESVYCSAETIAQEGPARLLLGHYGASATRLNAPEAISYLAVRLPAGERWTFRPAPGQTVGWSALSKGRLLVPEPVEAGELVVFDRSDAEIEFVAEEDCEFVVGAAVPHDHELVTGYYSVHSSAAALETGERNIREIGRQLVDEGRLPSDHRTYQKG